MDKNTYICDNCESEFRVKELYSEFTIQYCVYCGEQLKTEDE